MKECHVLSMSGGKDSTALAFFIRENLRNVWKKLELVFYDTGCDLKETYTYLNKIELFLNKKIIRVKPERSFEDIFYSIKVIPTMFRRWCTYELKIKPSNKFLEQKVLNNDYERINLYVGLRADEQYRKGVELKTNFEKKYIKPLYPLIENNITKNDVENILTNSGINYPDYYKWRTRNGCYFCPFQSAYSWVMLYENHPNLFFQAMEYEKIGDRGRKIKFKFNGSMTLEEILKNKEEIKQKYFNKTKLKKLSLFESL